MMNKLNAWISRGVWIDRVDSYLVKSTRADIKTAILRLNILYKDMPVITLHSIAVV